MWEIMKKICIIFLIILINFSLFHISFAQVGNDIISSFQCPGHNQSSSHHQENNCLQKCLSNINKISHIQSPSNEERSDKLSDIQDFFLSRDDDIISYSNLYNRLLLYEKNCFHIYYRWYTSLTGIIVNIN